MCARRAPGALAPPAAPPTRSSPARCPSPIPMALVNLPTSIAPPNVHTEDGMLRLVKRTRTTLADSKPSTLPEAVLDMVFNVLKATAADDWPTVQEFAHGTGDEPKDVLIKMVEKKLVQGEHFVGGEIKVRKDGRPVSLKKNRDNLSLKLTAKGLNVLAPLMPGSDGRDYSDFMFKVVSTFMQYRSEMIQAAADYESDRKVERAKRTAEWGKRKDIIQGAMLGTAPDEDVERASRGICLVQDKKIYSAIVPKSTSATAAIRRVAGYGHHARVANVSQYLTPLGQLAAGLSIGLQAAVVQVHADEIAAEPTLEARKRKISDVVTGRIQKIADDEMFKVSDDPAVQERHFFSPPADRPAARRRIR